MGVDDFFIPHGCSTTDSLSPSQPTIAELSAQMTQLLQMQTLAPNLIPNQDPFLMTPTLTSTLTPTPTTTLTPTSMMTPTSTPTPTPNLSLIQTPIPTSTQTPTPTQTQIPIRIPTKLVSYTSSAAQIMTSRLTTPTHGPDCEYYGDPRYTPATCFKLHGYPDWCATLKDRGQCNTTSNGTGYGFHTSAKIDSRGWIIDSGTGTVKLSSSLSLSNTLLVPSLSNKLLSDIHTKEILGRGTNRGGLYYVDDFSPGVANNVTHPFHSKQQQIWLWHRRLGHPSFSYMKHLIPDLFSGFKDSDFTCDTCILAKSHRVPYLLSTTKCTTQFMLIHSDVWRPSPITAPSGVRWFVTFIDDCTRMTWLYLLKNKNEVFFRFQLFHKQMKTRFNAQIHILAQTMVENLSIMTFKLSSNNMELSMKRLVLRHRNKMVLLNERIDIFLKPPEHF
ncbi:unnamed protein product [Prunus armeniaca]